MFYCKSMKIQQVGQKKTVQLWYALHLTDENKYEIHRIDVFFVQIPTMEMTLDAVC